MKSIPGHPEYFITAVGEVYKQDRHKGLIRLRTFIVRNTPQCIVGPKGKRKKFGLLKLVATVYEVPNPNNYEHVILKDFDRTNICPENLVWVSGEVFFLYCCKMKGGHIGRQPLVYKREESIKKCRDEYVRQYYKTLDESWLHEAWNRLEKNIYTYRWREIKAECYLYFLDRARRFSILDDPKGMILLYAKTARENYVKETYTHEMLLVK